MILGSHLQDEALFDCYYAERRGDALDPPSAEHLVDCEACARRYAEIGAFLTSLTDDAEAEVSALFPPERLRQQQHDIARRLELVGRAARVITFPGRAPGATPQTQPVRAHSVTRIAARWVAAAAAAGLFVGVAAGSVFNFNFGSRVDAARQSRRAGAMARQAVSAPVRLSQASVANAVVDMDDMFMSDLESVLDRPHTSSLTAFDALTPHVREVRDSRDFAR